MVIASSTQVSEETFRRLSLSDPQGQLELHHGLLVEKPGMSVEHGDVMRNLVRLLENQLDRTS